MPFGGVPFDLQSSCSLHLVTTDCAGLNEDDRHGEFDESYNADLGLGDLPRFQLSARNEERDTGQAIWVQGFVLEVYGYEIEVSRSFKHTVMVRYIFTLTFTLP